MEQKVYKKYHYLLYGLGKSNIAVKDYFDKNNIKYEIYIDKETKSINLNNIDVIVKSPGIKPDTDFLLDAKNKKIIIISDLELFYWIYPKSKLIIITGTNGKTSTCRLLAYLLSKKEKCYLGGNIGIPLLSLKSPKNFNNEMVIVEASSYMLDNTYSVVPFIYVILNIEEHHLDYHKTFNNYYNTKVKLINNLKEGSLLVYPKDDEFENKFKEINISKIKFNWNSTNIGVRIDNNYVILNKEILYKINQYPLLPKHQLTNVMISSSIALMLGIKPSKIRKALEDITYEDYRLQKIYDDQKTIIINDSKATNFSASKAALNSIIDNSYNLYWLIGGSGPNNIKSCIEEIKNVQKIYLFGQNKYEISKELTNLNISHSIENGIDDILNELKNKSEKKIILFSPASQSFDMFENFEKRGEYFNKLVHKYWHN